MKYLKRFNEGDIYMDDDSNNDVYAIMTKELENRLRLNRKPISMAQNGYLFQYSSLEELSDLKNKYSKGDYYNNEEITVTCTLKSSNI